MPNKVLWHHAQPTFVQACEKYCVERADPSWMKALDLVWGTSLPSLSLPRAHDYILPHEPVRDGGSTAPTSVAPSSAVVPRYLHLLHTKFARVLGDSPAASLSGSTRIAISARLRPADAPEDLYANAASGTSSPVWRRLQLENEPDNSRPGSGSMCSLPSLKDSGLLDCGDSGPLSAVSVLRPMADQQQHQHQQQQQP
jgi:hypothetical protein